MRHPGFLQFYILYWAHFHLKKTITRVEDEIRFLYQSILESLNITLYNTLQSIKIVKKIIFRMFPPR